MTLFDLVESQRQKEDGMAQAAKARAVRLKVARRIAENIALSRPDREANADDVGHQLAQLKLPQLGPEAGSLFKEARWEFTGKRVESDRVRNHAREIKIWRLK